MQQVINANTTKLISTRQKKIRVFNEENKNHLKQFAEGLTHKPKYDIPRYSLNSSRFKVQDELTQAQKDWFKVHRDEFVDISKKLV